MGWLLLVLIAVFPLVLGGWLYARGRKSSASKSSAPAPKIEPTVREVKAESPADSSPPIPGFIDKDSPVAAVWSSPPLPPIAEELLREDLHYVVRLFPADESSPPTEVRIFTPLAEKIGIRASQRIFGLDEKRGWIRLRGTGAHKHWIWATPLVSRAGRLDEKKMNAIEAAFRKFGEANRLRTVFPDSAIVAEHAGLLDKFCSEADVLLCLYAVSLNRAPQSAAKIASLAESEGFIRDDPGVFVRYRDNQKLFALKTRHGMPLGKGGDSVSGISFELDLPHVSRPGEGFSEMAETADKMAKVLRFTLVDEENNPLTRDSITRIRTQADALRKKMDDYGVVAGGALARILFS